VVGIGFHYEKFFVKKQLGLAISNREEYAVSQFDSICFFLRCTWRAGSVENVSDAGGVLLPLSISRWPWKGRDSVFKRRIPLKIDRFSKANAES
jgi:hypothetical protein